MRRVASLVVLIGLSVVGCDSITVVEADVDEAFTGFLEAGFRPRRYVDRAVLRTSHLTGDGYAEGYGLSGRTDCSASVTLTALQLEWSPDRTADSTGAFGLVLVLPIYGHMEIRYEDAGEQRAASNDALDDLGPGFFIQARVGRRSLLRWTYVAGIDSHDSLVEWRQQLGEQVAVAIGWRDLCLVASSERHYPIAISGSQLLRVSATGCVVGLALEF